MSIDLIIKDYYNNPHIGEIESKPISNYTADGSNSKTVWKIRIKSWDEYYSCYLLLDDISSNDDRPVEASFKFSLIDSQGKDIHAKSDSYFFEKNNSFGFDQFIHKDYLNVLGSQVIIDNSVTIRCEIRLLNSNGDLEMLHSDFEKIQLESTKRAKKIESLELDYDKNKQELLLKKVELKCAEAEMSQLRHDELEPLKILLNETEKKLAYAEKSWGEERAELNNKIDFLTKEFEEKSKELDEFHEKFDNLMKDHEALKIELELVRAMTESIDVNVSNHHQQQQNSSIEDIKEDWEKIDYEYY